MKTFLEKTGGDDIEGKIFQFLFDGNSAKGDLFDQILIRFFVRFQIF